MSKSRLPGPAAAFAALGLVFMRERLGWPQWVAVGLGLAGVMAMGLEYGRVPWVALSLAVSFGLYGLVKKLVGLNAMVSLGLETLFALPVAAVCLGLIGVSGNPGVLGAWGWPLAVLAGPVTAVPLMLFGHAAGRMPLSTMGFIQYLTPSINLVLGVFIFHETFGPGQALAFACIWAALVVFSASQLRRRTKKTGHAIVEE
jgi:chloramphenicol-sensitive protein RarD